MRALIREAFFFLAQRSRKNEKKGSIDEWEIGLYFNFLKRKKKAKFGGVARFCIVSSTMKFGTWDTHALRASERDDPRGCPFAIFDFCAFPRAWKKKAARTFFYEYFFKAFKTYRSPALFEPNVWLWIVEQERSVSVVQLFNSTMNLQYDLYYSTYIPVKTEGITVVQEARGVKQVGAVQLYFLTHKSSPTGRLPIKASSMFKKLYSLFAPHPKELMEETLYTIYAAYELRMNLYIGILKALTGMNETVYNVSGGTKFVYAALVSSCLSFFLSLVILMEIHERASI